MNLHHSMRFTNSKITLPFQNTFNPSSPSCGSKQSDRSHRSQNTKVVDTKSTSNQSRSISNLARFIQRKQQSSSSYLQNEQPDRIESNKDQHSHHLSTSTLSTLSSSMSGSSSFTMRNSNTGNRRSEKGTFSSQRLTRRSNTNSSSKQRSKSRSRTNSFNESRLWGSGGSSILLRRANTDEAIWSKLVPILSDNRDHRFRRHRSRGYNGNDFDIEEHGLVEIGERLPDRTIPLTTEDIFGRRRGDFLGEEDNNQETNECQLIEYNQDDCETDGTIEFESVGEQVYEPIKIGDESEEIENITMEDINDNEQARMKHEQDETMKTISKAIELSRGKLRKSANMSRAFKSVIKSGEGLIRKSELISAAMNGDQPKDPSVTILLEPKSMNYNETENDDDEMNRQEKDKKTREKKKEREEKKKLQSSTRMDINKRGSNSTEVNASTGFSTSMTAKQCAATLETILRELTCKVARYSHEVHEMKNVIRLKVTQIINGSKRSEKRTIRIMITIREEDNIRTSVSFRKLPGFTSRDTQITPLCLEIRDRFQREWPAVVEALYIRLPTPTKNISTM